ncbi:MAG: hypothetical protein ABW133_01715 [Polyangiaceae bacterium]
MTACKSRDDAGSSADASTAKSSAAPRSSASASPSTDASTDAGALVDASSDVRRMSSSATTTILAADASSNSCKLLRPPIMQPYGGPAFLRFVGAGSASMAELVFNESSRPRFSGTPLAQRRSFVDVPMPPKSTLPGCVALSQYVYCPDANGAIHRTDGGGENDTVVATGRAGTPLSVAPITPDHVLLAYIREANTSEGQVRMAEIKLDDGPPVHLSEDGSGATYVELMARGDSAIALTLDGRTAMTPAHVRIVRVEGGKVSLSRDAVVFVGGPAERNTRGRIALNAEGNAYVVVTTAHPADGFGMATVRLSHPPTEDEPAVWSMYPGAVDPAPLAVTHGISPIRVARARPSTAEPRSSLLLEVGELSPAGEFQLKCILAEAAYIKDLEMEIDRDGAMWLFWRDTRGSHLERRSLP